VLRALWKIDVHLISTLVNKSLYYNISCLVYASYLKHLCNVHLVRIISNDYVDIPQYHLLTIQYIVISARFYYDVFVTIVL